MYEGVLARMLARKSKVIANVFLAEDLTEFPEIVKSALELRERGLRVRREACNVQDVHEGTNCQYDLVWDMTDDSGQENL